MSLSRPRHVSKSIVFTAASFFLFFFLWAGPRVVQAQPGLIESDGSEQAYLLQLSGSVLNEKFDGAKAVLRLFPPNLNTLNDFSVVIEGYPATNDRNSFFWNSDPTEMISFSDELISRIKRSYAKSSGNHFFYLSPVLLKNKGPLTQHEEEDRKHAEKTAKPTKVFAQAGELHLRFSSNEVTGDVWMSGYDAVEHSFVKYQVRIWGRKVEKKMEPRQEPRR